MMTYELVRGKPVVKVCILRVENLYSLKVLRHWVAQPSHSTVSADNEMRAHLLLTLDAAIKEWED